MASAKESPRQKLVNLMYLVFLSLIALSADAEVLQGYEEVFEKTRVSTKNMLDANNKSYRLINERADEGEYFNMSKINELRDKSNAFSDQIEEIIQHVIEGEDNLSEMTKSDKLDTYFFQGEGLTEKGQAFLDAMEAYRFFTARSTGNSRVIINADYKFYTGDIDGMVENRDGIMVPWMSYSFKFHPGVGSIAKLALIQSDIRAMEAEILADYTRGALTEEADDNLQDYNNELDLAKALKPTASLTKANVVYRGIENPVEISIPGVSPDDIAVSGAKRVGKGKYVILPGKGKTTSVFVTGSLSDGTVLERNFVYRIKNIPIGVAKIGAYRDGDTGSKTTLGRVSLDVEFPDFDYPIKVKIKSFRVSVPGKASVLVRGNKLNADALKLVKGAPSGSDIRIYDVQSELVGKVKVPLRKPAGINITVRN